jgi:hypothetical protein
MSIMGELTDKTNEAEGFSMFGVLFGLGSMGNAFANHCHLFASISSSIPTVAPVLGGFLSKPVEKYPDVFGNSAFLKEYPYFLPNAACAVVSLLGILLGYVYLEETHSSKSIMRADSTVSETSALLSSSRQSSHTSEPAVPEEASFWGSVQRRLEPFSQLTVYSILCYSCISLVQVVVDETYSLWSLMPPEKGGLSFDTSDIGASLGFAGLLTLFVQIFLYPKVQKRFNTLACFRWAMFIYAAVLLVQPQLGPWALYLKQHPHVWKGWLWVPLLTLLLFRAIAATTAFTAAMMLVSHPPHTHTHIQKRRSVLTWFTRCPKVQRDQTPSDW